jgi:hypothetical protein
MEREELINQELNRLAQKINEKLAAGNLREVGRQVMYAALVVNLPAPRHRGDEQAQIGALKMAQVAGSISAYAAAAGYGADVARHFGFGTDMARWAELVEAPVHADQLRARLAIS